MQRILQLVIDSNKTIAFKNKERFKKYSSVQVSPAVAAIWNRDLGISFLVHYYAPMFSSLPEEKQKITMTLCPRTAKAFGKAPATSPSPPTRIHHNQSLDQ